MAKPVFRNPDKFQVLPFREWLRKNQPEGNQGYVVEDLDLVLRVYSRAYGTDDKGMFMLCELKFYPCGLGYAQRKTFGLVDSVLRKGDSEGIRYKGYFVVQYDNDDWDKSNFWVNDVPMDRHTFIKFTSFDPDVLATVPVRRF